MLWKKKKNKQDKKEKRLPFLKPFICMMSSFTVLNASLERSVLTLGHGVSDANPAGGRINSFLQGASMPRAFDNCPSKPKTISTNVQEEQQFRFL